MTDHSAAQRALGAIGDSGIEFVVTEHGPVRSLAEAADARGLTPDRVLKSIVVRRGEGDHLFVLVPGGRTISWPKLRGLLGVNRLSMPSAEDALEVTGYARGTITPFGSSAHLPVIADTSIPTGPVSIGGGAHGVAFTVDSAALVAALKAQVADVTEPE
ncbi:MAG: YbaK/EbsC family protein [Candidatus Nanopelagicales bacterium]|nr:YbaK/EbsC family protein [Actinomycetota bacterium]HNE88193.1 YbaK/EbsC family protein [Actinomycetota bacterium]HNL50785.1 YbaK/EbsC family protein [Actinomycetota bacterium]HNO15119.1 YbaK/EbsC family protein [Actinomycetota bacterium]HUM86169.1 YbaK/EbsC family protein [Actinomycetota bacterium]